MASGTARFTGGSRGDSRKQNTFHSKRDIGEPRVFALLGQGKGQRAYTRTNKHHHRKLGCSHNRRRDDTILEPGIADQQILVHSPRRAPNSFIYRTNSRWRMAGGKRENSTSSSQFSL